MSGDKADIGLIGLASHANGAQMSKADRDLLGTISQAQYVALIYAVTHCGFEPSAVADGFSAYTR